MTTDATQPAMDVSSRAYSQASDNTKEKDPAKSATARLYSEVSDLQASRQNPGTRTTDASVSELDFSADLFRSKSDGKPVNSAMNTDYGEVSASRKPGNHDVLPEPSPFKDLEKMIYNQYVHTNFDNGSKFLADGVTLDDVSSRISELSPVQRRQIFGAQSMHMTSDALAAQANPRQLKQLDDLGQYLGRLFGKLLGKHGEKVQSPDDLLKDKAVVDERTKLLKLAEKLPEAERKQLEQYIHDFEARSKKDHLSPEEVAKTYKQIERLLEPSGDKPIEQAEKNKLALEVMRHAAHPQDIDQGSYNTCNVTTVETRTYTRTPSEAAKLVADVALTGQYTAHDGTVVKVNPEAHGQSTLGLPTPDGTRDHASEIFQVTAVNIHYAQENAKTKPPGHIRYVQLGENDMTPTERLHSNGERLMDYSDPAHPKEVMENGKPVRAPNLDDNQICDVSEAITGKHEKGMLLSTKEGLPGHEGDDRITICNSEEDLRKRLKDAQANHEFPIIVQVFVDNDPFYTDGGWGKLPPDGGSHVVTITGYDAGPPERVDMDNQWGRRADHSVSVHDLFRSMNPPDQAIALLQKDVDYNREHHQIDYAKEFELLALKLHQGKISDSDYEAQAKAKMDELKRHFDNDHPSDAEKARDMLKVAEVIAQAPTDVQMRLIQREYTDGLINKETFDQAIAVAGWQIDHDYKHYSENGEWLLGAWWRHHRQSGQLDDILGKLPKEEQEAIRKKIEQMNKDYP